jgi:hypothetical protein
MPSKIPAISTRVGRLMRLIEGSQCIAGEESGVELELREALEKPPCTAIRKIQKQKYTSALATKIAIVVTDQGKGFDFGMMVGNALTTDPASEYGRGIHWINAFMDDVYFEPRGSKVHLRKRSTTASVYVLAREHSMQVDEGSRSIRIGDIR